MQATPVSYMRRSRRRPRPVVRVPYHCALERLQTRPQVFQRAPPRQAPVPPGSPADEVDALVYWKRAISSGRHASFRRSRRNASIAAHHRMRDVPRQALV